MTENYIIPTATSKRRNSTNLWKGNTNELLKCFSGWLSLSTNKSLVACSIQFWYLRSFPFQIILLLSSFWSTFDCRRRKKIQLLWYTWWRMLRVDRDQIRSILSSLSDRTLKAQLPSRSKYPLSLHHYSLLFLILFSLSSQSCLIVIEGWKIKRMVLYVRREWSGRNNNSNWSK